MTTVVDAAKIGSGAAVAPNLLQLELTNILLAAWRRKRISGVQLVQLSDAFDQMAVSLEPALTPTRRNDVLRLAQKHTLSAYDAAYLELAIRLGVPLASHDTALRRSATHEGVLLADKSL